MEGTSSIARSGLNLFDVGMSCDLTRSLASSSILMGNHLASLLFQIDLPIFGRNFSSTLE